MAEHNLSGKKTFATSWDNSKSGFFDAYHTDDTCPEGYHVPSFQEWNSIFYVNTYNETNAAGYRYYAGEFFSRYSLNVSSIYNNTEEIVYVKGVSEDRFSADYASDDKGNVYALRYKSASNLAQSAFRYQFIGPFDMDKKNSRVVVTQVYIGNNKQNNVLGDTFWNDVDAMYEKGITNSIVKRTLPMVAYFSSTRAGHGKVTMYGLHAEYCLSDKGYKMEIRPASSKVEVIRVSNIKTIDMGVYENPIRPFKDKL